MSSFTVTVKPGKLTFLSKEWPLLLIIFAGFWLRVKGLTYQSLWLDELHTMNELGPAASWAQLFEYLKTSEQQPPLYFVLAKIMFSVFGHTEYVARIFPAITGTISIWAMYYLGKVALNRHLGLIAAMLTCVNFFNLHYSQEARSYILAFLFATLSFAFFIKLVKTPSRRNALVYALFTLLFLYCHYFSLFAVTAQAVLALIFIFGEKGKERSDLFKLFLLAGIIIVIGYAPWIPYLLSLTEIKSTWIQATPPGFIQLFFYEYFGNAEILKLLLLPLLLVYVVNVALQAQTTGSIKTNA
ncbi:MAG TPA: glycosyltransferase family 39 protein, partial [Chitinophagaceae bacterium]